MAAREKHTVININIVEYDPNANTSSREEARGLNQDTRFTVRAETTPQAIRKAMRRLKSFDDTADE